MKSRIELQIARRGPEVVVVLCLIAVILFGTAGYVYATPPLQPGSTTSVDRQEFRVTMTDSVVVTKGTPLYTTGEKLTDREAYFTQVSETLLINGSIEVPAGTNVSYKYALNATATRNGQAVWHMEEVFAEKNQTVSDGKIYENATLDIGLLNNRLARVENVVEPAATVDVRLVLVVAYTSESASGTPYTGTVRLEREFVMIDNAYWVEGEQTAVETEETLVKGEPEPGPPDYTSIGLLIGSGLAAAVIGILLELIRRRLPSVEVLKHRADRASYDEWISTGTFVDPEGSIYIELDSLDDIVNTAIDAKQRVIYDTQTGVYALYTWPYVYVFVEHTVSEKGESTDSDDKRDGEDDSDETPPR